MGKPGFPPGGLAPEPLLVPTGVDMRREGASYGSASHPELECESCKRHLRAHLVLSLLFHRWVD